MDARYVIRAQGHLGPVLRASFAELRCHTVSGQSTIRGRLSAEQLRTLLSRLDACGIELIHVRCQYSDLTETASDASAAAPEHAGTR